MRPFVARYPAFLRKSPEFRDLQEALEPELLELWAARDGAMDQLFVESASWGLRYWERTLGLSSEAGKDLEARRSRVRSRLLGADVSTVSLVERVAEIYAKLPARVEEHPERFCSAYIRVIKMKLRGNPNGHNAFVEMEFCSCVSLANHRIDDLENFHKPGQEARA